MKVVDSPLSENVELDDVTFHVGECCGKEQQGQLR